VFIVTIILKYTIHTAISGSGCSGKLY